MAIKVPHRLYLTEDQIPEQWYNLRADMKEQAAPMINPATGKPAAVEDLYPVFCKELAQQEMDNETRYFDIPEEVRDIYKIYRPAPLCRAYNLEKALDTPAKIYYKFEGNNTSGSHKLNSAVAQAYYAKKEGLKGVTTETGAGQWGTALSEACSYFGLDLQVYMVKVSYNQKPFRKDIMKTFGAQVFASPSDRTEAGRKILAEDPDNSGSLGCAISEAVEVAVTNEGYRYVLGSVLNQVLLHQSIIGLESKIAMEQLDEYPDIVIGCAGGGSNLGGLIAPSRLTRGLSRWNRHPVRPSQEVFTNTISATPARSRRWLKCTPWAAPSSLPQTTPEVFAITACPQSCPSCMRTSTWRQKLMNRPRCSKQPFSLQNWRRSCLHRNPHMRSAAPLTKH